MSPTRRFEWQRAIRDDTTLSSTAKLLGHTLYTYLGHDGTCYPSSETLAEGMGLVNPRSVSRPRQELVRSGYITYTPPGVGRKHLYKAVFDYQEVTPESVTYEGATGAIAYTAQCHAGDTAECHITDHGLTDHEELLLASKHVEATTSPQTRNGSEEDDAVAASLLAPSALGDDASTTSGFELLITTRNDKDLPWKVG